MLAPLLTAMLLAPPSHVATDESVLYEPAAVAEPEDAEPGFAPVEITPPPERPALSPEPAPSPEPPPSFEPAPLELLPPPPPPTGAGRLVGGSIGVGLGLAALSVVFVEAGRPEGDPRFVAATFVPLGLASIGLGTYLLVRGAKARANFKGWRDYTGRDALPTGGGLLVGGTLATVIGGVTLVAASVQAREPDAFERALTPTLFGIGGASVVAGVGALTFGLLRRSRYRAWRQSTFIGAVPVVVPLRAGVSVSWVGRF